MRTASSELHPACSLICFKPNGESFSSRMNSGFRGRIASIFTLIHSCARSSVTERAPAAESSSVMKARRPAVMQGSMEMAKKTDGRAPAGGLGAHLALAAAQPRDQRRGFGLASQRPADARNRVVKSLEASGVHQKDRNPHALDSANGLRVIQRRNADHNIRMQDGDPLQRWTQNLADARLLPRLRRIERVVGDADDVGSSADGIDRVGNARGKADDAVNVVRKRDLAARLIGNNARSGGRSDSNSTARAQAAVLGSTRWRRVAR